MFGKDNNDNGFVLCARFFDDWTLIAINYKEIITLVFLGGGFEPKLNCHVTLAPLVQSQVTQGCQPNL